MAGEPKSLEQLARERLGANADEKVERDDARIRRRHTIGGSEAARDIGRGRDAHVFDAGIDLEALERRVWERGEELPAAVREWRRFWLLLEQRIGTRVQNGRAAVPLHGVEIKARIEGKAWRYHLVPRATRAKEQRR